MHLFHKMQDAMGGTDRIAAIHVEEAKVNRAFKTADLSVKPRT
jgi:hypothetical protein